MSVDEANRPARAWPGAKENPTSVDVDLTTAQIHRQGGCSVQVGGNVEFSANAPTSGTTLLGVHVQAAPGDGQGGSGGQGEGVGHGGQGNGGQAASGTLSGTVTAVGSSTISVTVNQVSENVATYLAANSSPTTVTIDGPSAKIFRDHGGVLTVGDTVVANAPVPASGLTFTASTVVLEPAPAPHGGGRH